MVKLYFGPGREAGEGREGKGKVLMLMLMLMRMLRVIIWRVGNENATKSNR